MARNTKTPEHLVYGTVTPDHMPVATDGHPLFLPWPLASGFPMTFPVSLVSRFIGTLALVTTFLAMPAVFAQHGVITDLSASGDPLCEHNVPGSVCVLCEPERVEAFRVAGDWCRPHRVPESQCFRCHPDLRFDAMPEIPADADHAELSDEQALAGLEAFVVPGKVTVFEFDAPWCAPCRNLKIHLRTVLANEPRLAVRVISVPSWDGPVFDRYLSRVGGLPFVIVYGTDGTLLGSLEQFEHSEIDALIARGLGATP